MPRRISDVRTIGRRPHIPGVRPSGFLTLLLASLFFVPVLGRSDDWKENALQNEYLNDHFREVYRLRTGRTGEVYRRTPAYGERTTPSPLGRIEKDPWEEREIERFVQNNIRLFVSQVEERLEAIGKSLESVSETCAGLLDEAMTDVRRRRLRSDFRRLEREATELRRSLETVFRDLPHQEDLVPSSIAGPCGLETLRGDVRTLEARVRGLIGGSDRVVSADPRESNPLVLLSRIRSSAALFRDSL